MKKLWLFLPILLGWGLLSHATDTRFGERVKVTETVTGDLYIGAGNIEVLAPVYGDLVAAGGKLYIEDSITADLMLFGGDISIRGFVGDDARLAGGKLVLRGHIRGDLFIGGGEVLLAPETVVAGNVYIAGGQVTLEGTVEGYVKLAGGLLTVRGTIGGIAELTGGELVLDGTFRQAAQLAGSTIILDDDAQFFGDVRYYAEDPVDFSAHLRGGATATLDESLAELVNTGDWQNRLKAGMLGWMLYRVLAAALLILLLVWLLPRFWERVGLAVEEAPTRALGQGVLYFLGVPLLILVSFLIVIGIPVGIFLLGTYLFTITISHVIVAVAAAYWLQMRREHHWTTVQTVLVSSGLFVALKVLSWIPILGWIVSMLSVILAFGAVVLVIRALLEERRARSLTDSED